MQDDYGVRLKVNVKIVDKDVVEVETYLRTLLEDMFFGEFGFKFESIEIKVMVLTPTYKSDKAAIEAIVAEKVAEIRAEQPEELKPEAVEAEKPAENTAVAEAAEPQAVAAESVAEQSAVAPENNDASEEIVADAAAQDITE